jgi:hypothetical protein
MGISCCPHRARRDGGLVDLDLDEHAAAQNLVGRVGGLAGAAMVAFLL